jgi:hypothetical protein
MRGQAAGARRAFGLRRGVTVLALGVSTLATVSAQGLGSPAYADSTPYELYCPHTPVGNFVFNDVVTSGAITPPDPGAGETFQLTDYQTTLVIPSSLVGAAAALGDTEMSGTAITEVHATGASPSAASQSTGSFDVRIPSPIPDQGMVVHVPTSATTVGPFTASGVNIALTQDKRTRLTLEVSGSALVFNCTAHRNHSEPTGIVRAAPYTTPIAPVIAVATTPLVITTTALHDAKVGQEYSATMTAVGGNPPYIWKLAPGSAKLPQGLELNRRTGVITGKPNHRDSGAFPFTVEVLDKKTTTKPRTQDVTTKALSITVS